MWDRELTYTALLLQQDVSNAMRSKSIQTCAAEPFCLWSAPKPQMGYDSIHKKLHVDSLKGKTSNAPAMVLFLPKVLLSFNKYKSVPDFTVLEVELLHSQCHLLLVSLIVQFINIALSNSKLFQITICISQSNQSSSIFEFKLSV